MAGLRLILAFAMLALGAAHGADSRIGSPLGHEASQAVGDEEFAFRTPGNAAYCANAFSNGQQTGFTCITPNDGFYLRLGNVQSRSPTVVKGYSSRYRGFRDPTVSVLAFGEKWWPHASHLQCWSRGTGLTCKHYYGLTFWLGRYRGYRIFRQVPGYPPDVRPLFRISVGVWCGINRAVLEEADPLLLCWTPRNGSEFSVAHSGDRGRRFLRPAARGYRPQGFPLLAPGSELSWRCLSVRLLFAERCSTSRGTPVFRCVNGASGLECRNRRSHGFLIGRTRFRVF